MRVCLVGFGTVGRWVAGALRRLEGSPGARDWGTIELVGVANARDGFVFREGGLDPGELARLVAAGRPLTEHPGIASWQTAAEGLAATDADLLIETSASPSADGEPGLAHIREALARGMGVVTSNKWPVALAGVELAETARRNRVPFRAEATVMSGTPVVGPLTEGLGGAEPRAVRGVLNATVNALLGDLRGGATYEAALARAQEAGLAEPDPSADVEGHDSVAKVMILAGLVFGRQLRVDQVSRRGISELAGTEFADARENGMVLREVSSFDAASSHASVAPELLDPTDPLAAVDGRMNSVVCTAEPLGEIQITGPGAGPELAGQGCLSDLLAVARWE